MTIGHILAIIKIAGRNHIFHLWELHGKRNIDNSQEGIKIEC